MMTCPARALSVFVGVSLGVSLGVGWGSRLGLPVAGAEDGVPVNLLRQLPQHPHDILRPPAEVVPPPESALPGSGLPHHSRGRGGGAADRHSQWLHPPFTSHQQRAQAPPAVLPGARQRHVWKAPYSYGYFGASAARHWSLHHGYRDRYTEWRFE